MTKLKATYHNTDYVIATWIHLVLTNGPLPIRHCATSWYNGRQHKH